MLLKLTEIYQRKKHIKLDLRDIVSVKTSQFKEVCIDSNLTLHAKNKNSVYQMEVCMYAHVQIHDNGSKRNMKLESNFKVYTSTNK